MDYSQSFGKAIGLQGQPKLSVQIALERERRASAMQEAEQRRKSAEDQANQKRKQDQYNILSSEISIKDPTKYHRFYLNEAIEDKRKTLEKLANAYATDWTNAPNVMRDELAAYQTRQGVRQQGSKVLFDEQAKDPKSYAVSNEFQNLLRTGNVEDAVAWSNVIGKAKGIQSAVDPETGVTLFNIENFPRVDTQKPFNEFAQSSNLKQNYIPKLGTQPFAKADGMSYFRDTLNPNPEKLKGLEEALIGDPDYRANIIRDTPDEELSQFGVSLDNPKSIEDFVRAKIQEKSKGVGPIINEDRVNTPSSPRPTEAERQATKYSYGKSGEFTGTKYRHQPLELPDGRYKVQVDQIKGEDESVEIIDVQDKDGNIVSGELQNYYVSPNGKIEKATFKVIPEDANKKIAGVKSKYKALYDVAQDDKKDQLLKDEAKEISELVDGVPKKIVSIEGNSSLESKLNAIYLEGKKTVDEYFREAFDKAGAGKFVDPASPKKATFPLPEGKPRRGKKNGVWYIWDERTGKYLPE